MDWKEIPNDTKEKYALYLCSVEWGRLRAGVHERAGGFCERCGIREISAVHHLSYERKYRESLEDLEGICDPCHKTIHGIEATLFDPAGAGYMVAYILGMIETEKKLCGKLGQERWQAAANFVSEAYFCKEHRGTLLKMKSAGVTVRPNPIEFS